MTSERNPRILFISHSYPPIMGGVESQNFHLARGLSQITDVKIIANGKGKIWLPIFIPFAFLRSIFFMIRYDVCLVGNGVLAPVAAALKFLYPRKKFFSVVHGLDITFASKKGILSRIYRVANIPSLKVLDGLFMVGNATIEEAVKIGVPRELCVFIPNGVSPELLRKSHSREKLSTLFGDDVFGKKVILRLARFVPHKGTSWFIRNVMPKLGKDIVMIAAGHRVARNTAGDPDNFIDCERIVREKGLEARVKLLPSLSQEDVNVLLNTADLVVSPNIRYPGSMEGFGINVIEASACGRMVLASNLEGLADAVKEGKNGFLLEPENANVWANAIEKLFAKNGTYFEDFGMEAAKFTEENFSWDSISRRYLEGIRKAK
ncbi:MAG: glycosyltransferase family 4 protein [Minisyncoccota bacterium]